MPKGLSVEPDILMVMTKMVRGAAVAQYIRNRPETTASPGLADQSNMLIEEKDFNCVRFSHDRLAIGIWVSLEHLR